MIFKGYLQIGGDEQLNGWVDGVLKIRRKDFIPQLVDFSQQLVEYSEKMAQESGAHWEHLQGFASTIMASVRLPNRCKRCAHDA